MQHAGRRRFTPLEERIDAAAHRLLDRAPSPASRAGRWRARGVEFLVFGAKQAWACLFGALMLAAIIAARLLWPDDAALARNDLLVIVAIGIQVFMLAARLETGRELWVIVLFHLVGTAMEIFKTAMGSWQYDDGGVLRIAGVPLFTGFMYAAVGSYMVRTYRLFDLRFVRYPPVWATCILAAAIYANFFLHHFWWDARWVLLGAVALLYVRTTMHYRVFRGTHRMHLLVAFGLVALFIWFAENIGTLAGAWAYPNQAEGWELVSLSKVVSWFLLMIISVVLVTLVYPPRAPASDVADGGR